MAATLNCKPIKKVSVQRKVKWESIVIVFNHSKLCYIERNIQLWGGLLNA